MELKVIETEFTVCKIKEIKDVDFSGEYVFLSKTDEELSLVCSTKTVPKDCIAVEHGWRGFRVQGVLDFSLIGILSRISTILAESEISIFAISTYNTDYLLVKEESLQDAVNVLQRNGFVIK